MSVKFHQHKVNFAELQRHCHSADYIKSINKRGFDKSFYGYTNFEDMQEDFKKFKRTGVDMLNKGGFEVIKDVAGFMPNIEAYINGEPEAMYNFNAGECNNLIEVKIYMSMAYAVTAEQIRDKGLILADFIERNSNARDRFKITFIAKFSKLHVMKSNSLKMKYKEVSNELTFCDYNDYMTNELLGCLCSPAMYRYYILGLNGLAQGHNVYDHNGCCVGFNELTAAEQETTINYMNIENELHKIKLS